MSSTETLLPNNAVILSCSIFVASLDILAGELEEDGAFMGDGEAEDGTRVVCLSCMSSAKDDT